MLAARVGDRTNTSYAAASFRTFRRFRDCSACQRSCCICRRSQLSAVVLNAIDSRIAISGLRPARPFQNG